MIPTQNEATPTSKAAAGAAATDAERVAAEIGTDVGRQLGEAVGAATGQAAARVAEETVDQLKAQASERLTALRQRTLEPLTSSLGEVRAFTRQHPLASVGCAVGLGYLLGLRPRPS